MIGPMPRGYWSRHATQRYGSRRMALESGCRYRVTAPFRDFDGHEHPAGEAWEFLGYSFLPYDDGLSLFVSLDGLQEWHVRFHLGPESEGADIVDNLEAYVAVE